MLFSIIVPIYKVEKFLDQCVNSILTQTFEDFELILVDDGSPDNCPKMCDGYAESDARVKVIHKPNGGQSSARNEGLKLATGEYVVYLDSDDFFASTGSLAYIAEKTSSKPDIIVYKTARCDENGEKITYPPMDMSVLKYVTSLDDMVAKTVTNEIFQSSAWSKAIRRKLLSDNNIQFKTGLSGEDIDWYLDVIRKASSYDFVDEYLYAYRLRAGSVTTASKLKNLTDLIWILEKWDGILGDNARDIALRHYIGKTYSGLLILYAGLNDPQKTDYKSKIKSMSEMLKYDGYPRTKTVHRVYRVMGFNVTVFLLRRLLHIKNRKNGI